MNRLLLSVECLDCSYFLAIMNNAASNIHVQCFWWTCVFISLRNTPRSRTAGLYVSVLDILRNCQIVLPSGSAVYIPTSDVKCSNFSMSSPTLLLSFSLQNIPHPPPGNNNQFINFFTSTWCLSDTESQPLYTGTELYLRERVWVK